MGSLGTASKVRSRCSDWGLGECRCVSMHMYMSMSMRMQMHALNFLSFSDT